MGLYPIHVDHPKDERFDDIHIYIVPRWKESDLSGDEWRFNYVAEIKRKGETIIRISASNLSWLLQSLQWKILTAGEKNNFDKEAWARTKNKCDQPGCSEVATVFYGLIKSFSNRGEELARHRESYRQFCNHHSYRGDCALDDADHNYFKIENPINK